MLLSDRFIDFLLQDVKVLLRTRQMVPLIGTFFLYIIEEIEADLEQKENFKIKNSFIYERFDKKCVDDLR
jgi:hypothetical protein